MIQEKQLVIHYLATPKKNRGLTSIPMSEGNISDYLETLPEYERKMMLLFASGETTREVGSSV